MSFLLTDPVSSGAGIAVVVIGSYLAFYWGVFAENASETSSRLGERLMMLGLLTLSLALIIIFADGRSKAPSSAAFEVIVVTVTVTAVNVRRNVTKIAYSISRRK
jgi:ABC-type dipeptide/oligopeptide/nickel transport system permease subunit